MAGLPPLSFYDAIQLFIFMNITLPDSMDPRHRKSTFTPQTDASPRHPAPPTAVQTPSLRCWHRCSAQLSTSCPHPFRKGLVLHQEDSAPLQSNPLLPSVEESRAPKWRLLYSGHSAAQASPSCRETLPQGLA
ncbi:hypothetical protein B0T14DRAFT_236276 [Immersiella caudata]|uniref:Uncharacterized protein n=1 Tax=Immersiella caudata TaxID=314043 RepID=A0AA39WSB9_9PEZI|nr:hypothetical protein B0T14DRAFT_236276 [Immersiella caudata]